MTFYSEPAFFILVAVLAVPAVVLGLAQRQQKGYGLVASLLFVVLLFCRDAAAGASFALFFAVAAGTTFVTFRAFKRKAAHAVALYRVMLALMLVPLVVVKVSEVFGDSLLAFAGISYLTFKAVQVLIEIRDGLITELNPLDYCYFLVFFAPFTSGPIQRSRDFMQQIAQPRTRQDYLELLARGALWMLKGAVYYFVLAALFQWLMWFAPSALEDGTAGMAALSAVVHAFAYGMDLFFNFAGYSFMAMGVGAAFGIEVPTNFRAPFRSIDIKDFWNRWHITLSFWLRDYVFMRLTRSLLKHKVFSSRVTCACCGFMANMVIMGAWHGLTVDYLLYGAFHGALLALCEVYQKKSKFHKSHRNDGWYRVMTWAFTMVAVFFGFALFSGQVTAGIGGLHG